MKTKFKEVNLKIFAKVRVCDLGQNSKITKSFYFCCIHQENTCKSFLHSNLIILTDFQRFTVNENKLQNKSIFKFSLKSVYTIQVKIWKWLKLLNSVPFIKKTLVNQVYIRIQSCWLTFTVLQWMKTNFKISEFSRFLPMSVYVIQEKISKWLKLLYSVPLIKKTLVNHLYFWIWSFWLTFRASQWIKAIFKISQFEDFC